MEIKACNIWSCPAHKIIMHQRQFPSVCLPVSCLGALESSLRLFCYSLTCYYLGALINLLKCALKWLTFKILIFWGLCANHFSGRWYKSLSTHTQRTHNYWNCNHNNLSTSNLTSFTDGGNEGICKGKNKQTKTLLLFLSLFQFINT